VDLSIHSSSQVRQVTRMPSPASHSTNEGYKIRSAGLGWTDVSFGDDYSFSMSSFTTYHSTDGLSGFSTGAVVPDEQTRIATTTALLHGLYPDLPLDMLTWTADKKMLRATGGN
jgi:hypothetical protein